MVNVIEKQVDVDIDLDSGVHAMIAQLPNRLAMQDGLYRLTDVSPREHWLHNLLSLCASHQGPEQLHFLFLPESSVPFQSLPQVLKLIDQGFSPNTVTTFGLEHIPVWQYRSLLHDSAEDNEECLEHCISQAGQVDDSRPTNVCVTVVKEQTGKLRCFFSAKTHPFVGEESINGVHDLYRGSAFLLFRCKPILFNFMPILCFDYVFRDLCHSNIMSVIEHANHLYVHERQQLNLVAVIQCNPKPEHKAFADVVGGFYAERLFKTPGTRDAITLFVNTSAGTVFDGRKDMATFGHSSVVCGAKHNIPHIELDEFQTDNFNGNPVSRLRFGSETRLYSVRLFPHHEPDPRSSRAMVKVTGVFSMTEDSEWEQLTSRKLLATGSGD